MNNMIEIIIISINAILPIFILMIIGYTLKQISFYTDDHLQAMNKLVFYVLLPGMLFYNIYTADLENTFRPILIIQAAVVITIIFGVSMLFVPRIVTDEKSCGAVVQGIVRSNYILMAIPLAAALAGDEGIASASMMGAFIIPYMNILSVIILERFRGQRANLKQIGKKIVANPLVAAAMLGMLFTLLKIPVPQPVTTALKNIQQAASPLALIVLGGSFHFETIKTNMKYLVLGIISKLIIIPAVFLPLLAAAGYRGAEYTALLCLFATPPASSTFTLAKQMNSDSELAGQFLTIATACSVITIFVVVYISLWSGLI